jgi:hypothetical protein
MECQIYINSNDLRYLQLFEEIINWINARMNQFLNVLINSMDARI